MSNQSTPVRPGVVTAARIILFVVCGLSGALLVMNLLESIGAFLHPDGPDAVFATVGATTGSVLRGFLLGLITIVLLLVAALRIGKGGTKNHLVVRLLVGGGGLVSVLDVVLFGGNAVFMVIVLALVVLMLLQTKRSREWFAAMDSTARNS
ncbi:hypothetical protein NE857_14475 [Nocardiopsis exhalans]|uniref:Integral membrane protein n=1 Tax=Nocardiopsis exhalans TaxID=163604 RepID=A0ABY5DHM2_9ACTN|nr:hypothetical protein [Nocardiopsis exhalans]USY22703.1 hypothetical protein NE857_14475 [Nocardiopsis exhalans]